ncbi:helix-turn-helix domain-containing protein [Amycolatopsis circi]|uniref:helix-turn-helix domain-containing protein n=1 Tax=Amycolatopsis circi TaxID=871959 RepID=UPI000E266CB0|nr:helix-turn-helix domain-containing protein [Amycolatopsis circi]
MTSSHAERNAALLRDHQAGLSDEEIGQRYGVTPKHVRKLIGRLTEPGPAAPGSLKHRWTNNPSVFARPAAAPPPRPRPIKFTCRTCGGTVSPRTWECGGCGLVYRSFAKLGGSK